MEKIFIATDCCGNTAVIEELELYPYKDAPHKVPGYRLTLTSGYNPELVYFVSIYETLNEAGMHLPATFEGNSLLEPWVAARETKSAGRYKDV